jgi:HSP20 family molecular chaperone IbpA
MLIREFSKNLFDLLDVFNSDFAEYPLLKRNISENDENFVVELAVPGASKEDVKVKAKGQTIEISIKKNGENEKYTLKYKLYLGLGSNIDFSKSKSKVDKGILTLTLPKINKDIEILID